MFYETIEEASTAAIELNIATKLDYEKKYKQDPLLPSSPDKYYSDFEDWGKFLGTGKDYYPTVKQASKAAIKLNLTSRESYKSD